MSDGNVYYRSTHIFVRFDSRHDWDGLAFYTSIQTLRSCAMTDHSDLKHVCHCDCGIDQDHVVVFRYWKETKPFPSTLTISTGLNHYLPVWRRLIVAIKYVLGIDNTYCTYTETSLSMEGASSLQDFINNVMASEIEKETEPALIEN